MTSVVSAHATSSADAAALPAPWPVGARRRLCVGLAFACLCLATSGCETYRAEPLPLAPDMAAATGEIDPAIKPPLNLAQVATFAVLRNPDLVSSRRKSDVAGAQAFAAGLLPDPQLTANLDRTTTPGYIDGYAFGLAGDLQALLLHGPKEAAAKAAADQAKLSMLWDEWQTIEKACSLFVQKQTADEKLLILHRSADILQKQAERSAHALDKGDTTLDLAGADLSAALDIASQRDSAERDSMTADMNLKTLLNVSPTAELLLTALDTPPPVTRDQLEAALGTMRDKRPDILALQAGYDSQEQNVRAAILEQFPSFSLGLNHSADTSNVHSISPSATITLPLFTGARGDIRVQRATRAQLRAEYQARIDETTADAWRVWTEAGLLRRQIAELESRLPGFRDMAAAGQKAYDVGNLPPATYVLLQTSLSSRETELLDLKSSLWLDTLSLHTLLGMPFIDLPEKAS